MNVLELCDFFSNYASNFVPSIAFLEKELNRLGHKVFFIFSKRNLSKKFFEWEEPFSKEHSATLLDFSTYKIVKDVVAFISEHDIKIVHAHFIASFYLSEIKKRCPDDVVFYEHIHSAPYNNVKTFKATIKRMRNLFILDKKIEKICVSNAIAPMTKYIYPLTNVTTCLNALDFNRLSKCANNNFKDFSILMFGYNFYVKGVDLAIDAVLKLSFEFNVRLDIVLSANFEENKNKIIEIYGKIPDCIKLLPPTSDVVSLYKNHRIFLNASRSEGLSFANIESYYSGMLCVFSNISANSEANLPGVLYFGSNSFDELYKTLKHAYCMGNNYLNDLSYVESNFSLLRWSNELIRIFRLN